ncbi:PKD domain-containing protein, partial [Bacteroidota bacterium]
QTSGGPDAYGYRWKNRYNSSSPPTYKWYDISTIGTLVTGLGDDNYSGPFNIPNGFHFYWYDVNQFWVGSNGFISLTKGDNIASPFPASIPLTSGANNWLAPLLADLNFSGTSNPAKCYYYSNGDTFCISFIDVPFWANTSTQYTGSNTFQIILSNLDSSITFNYLSTDMGTLTTIDNIVGIENVTGSLGLSTYIDALPPDTMTVKYYYPPSVTYQAVDAGVVWNDNVKNGGIFLKKGGPAKTMIAKIKNYGNQTINSFQVFDSVRNSSNNVVSTSSITGPVINMGIDTTVTFTNTFSPTTAGSYTNNTRLSGVTGDIVASNNYLQQEVIVIDTTQALMTLEYSDGSYSAGLGWNGGNGGIGVYFAPPVYPARIKSTRYYISANGSSVPFYAMIYDDDGVNGAHGTLLDSVYVPASSFSTGAYKTVTVADTNLLITSGGVYVLWLMGGAGINIGKDLDPPFSRRTYEVLGGSWSNYRDILTEDFLIGMNIETVYPKANFSISSSNDPQIKFTDISGKYPTSWYWTFGDNTTSTLRHPNHTYTVNGTYNVCLVASNAYGSDTICKNATVYNVPPIADFYYDLTNDPQVSFHDTSTSNPTSWFWDFDDYGSTSTAQNPVFDFKRNGAHTVCLKATNGGGSDSICKSLTIYNAPPKADFTFDLTADPVVDFTDNTDNNPTTWLWDFGDNTSSSAQNPSHTYTSNGTFTVCLKVTGTLGADSICKQVVIEMIKPIANFAVDTLQDPKLRFTDVSASIPLSWYWTFGNGSSSTLQNPSNTYASNGSYQVCLKVTNAGGADSICKTVYVHKIAPVANWTYIDSLDPTIYFVDASSKMPTSWSWTFGDGGTSTLQNPDHTYTEIGSYNICLTVTNSGGTSKKCQAITITKVPPLADFTVYTALDPKVIFYDASSKKPASWLWDFDDNGATSTLSNPTYTFTSSGDHNVCLTVTNTGGSDSICKKVTVTNIPPVADFTYDLSADPQVTFTDLSTNQPSTWAWNFDDNGATSTLQHPVYTFTKNGTHKICLTVYKSAGSSSLCKNIMIYNVLPVAKFKADTSADPLFRFTDQSTNATNWYWDFGDGTYSSTQNPNHSYTLNGAYQVWLKVTNAAGEDSTFMSINVQKLKPVADFEMDSSADPKIYFIDKTTNIPTSWAWDFDDNGATSALQNPDYTFSENGSYKVCLTSTNANGNTSKCKFIIINKVLPVASFEYDTSNMPSVKFTDKSTKNPISWLWDFDDDGNDNSTLQNPVFTFNTDGLHNVCLTVTNSAGSSSPYCQSVLVNGTGINDVFINPLLVVYPNPFSDHAVIQIITRGLNENIQMNCYNLLGEKVFIDYHVVQNRIELNRGQLANGSYFFEIYNDQIKIGKGKFILY